jgi:pimeloyl-ACP methyl ester carboxylesterase
LSDNTGIVPYLQQVSELAGVPVQEFVVPADRQLIAGDMRLHYLDWGTDRKPWLVFLHGGAQTAHTWDIVCLALRDRYHAVAVDLRGHGDSEWSPELDYGLAAHARDVLGLLDELGAERAILVGMSLGGMSAMYATSLAPERVRALVMIDVSPTIPPERGRDVAAFMRSAVELNTLDDYVEQALSFNPRRDRGLLRTSLLFNLRERPDGGLAWKWDPRPMAGSPELRADWNQRRQELWERAGRIETPTLLVRGGESRMLLPADADELVAHMPDARWVEVEHAGHTVQGDNPAGLLRELDAFLPA